MADNDYIGNLQNSRWQSLNAGYLNRTPSWMQGDFKQGTPTSTARYQPAHAKVHQSWDGGQIRDTRTRPVAANAVNAIGQGMVQRNLNVQEEQQQAQAQQQIQNQFYNTWSNAQSASQMQAMQNQYANAFKQPPATPVKPNPILSGYKAGMAKVQVQQLQNQYFNPGAPTPAPFTPTAQQQQAITGVQQMKASRQAPPSKKPAKTRAQRRSMGAAAIDQIRQSLNNPSIP